MMLLQKVGMATLGFDFTTQDELEIHWFFEEFNMEFYARGQMNFDEFSGNNKRQLDFMIGIPS